MHRILSISLLLGSLFVTAIAQGQAPVVPKGVSGYTVKVQDDWVKGDKGFCPVRVTIETNPPANVVNDTLFTISIHHRNYQASSVIASAPLTIPAEQKSGSTEL